MPYGSSSATGDVGVARTGLRIIGAMRPSAARGETSGHRRGCFSKVHQLVGGSRRAPAFAKERGRSAVRHLPLGQSVVWQQPPSNSEAALNLLDRGEPSGELAPRRLSGACRSASRRRSDAATTPAHCRRSSNATTRTPASRVLTNPWQSLSAGGSSGWRLVWSFSSKALSRRRWVYATRSPAMSVGDGLLRAGDRSSSKMEIASVTRGSFNWWSISQLAAERRTAVWSVRLAAGTSGGYISTWRAARRPVVALCDPLRRRALALDRANAYWKKTPLRSCPTPGEPTLV